MRRPSRGVLEPAVPGGGRDVRSVCSGTCCAYIVQEIWRYRADTPCVARQSAERLETEQKPNQARSYPLHQNCTLLSSYTLKAGAHCIRNDHYGPVMNTVVKLSILKMEDTMFRACAVMKFEPVTTASLRSQCAPAFCCLPAQQFESSAP